jgi:hypothetical protein
MSVKKLVEEFGVVHFPRILGYTGAQNHRPARVGFWWKDVLFERR